MNQAVPLMPRSTFATKWLLPYTLVSLVLLGQWYWEVSKGDPDHISMLLIAAAFFVMLFFVIKRNIHYRPDEVLDAGNHLRVVFDKTVCVVPLSSIEHVAVDRYIRLTKVTLYLRTPIDMRDSISFYPIQEDDASGQNIIAVALKEKVEHENSAK